MCLLTVASFALLPCHFSLMVTDIHNLDCSELPPVCDTRMYVFKDSCSYISFLGFSKYIYFLMIGTILKTIALHGRY